MDANRKYFKVSLLMAFIAFTQLSFSQDTSSTKFSIDTSFHFSNITFSMSSASADYLYDHSPTKEDSLFYKKHNKLVNAEPDKHNYEDYFSLACSLWELSKLPEAEKMLLKIMDSHAAYYEGTSYHSSDIPGDTTTNSYGYGSFTSNYKNYACRYLTKIYLEEKKYQPALKYLEYADKKYTIEYSCGTGNMWYRDELKGLYGLCYEGLNRYEDIINMFLPDYSNFHNGSLIRALKKTYSAEEINSSLKKAENSIVCVVDTFQSSSYTILNYGEKNEVTKESKYTSGKATMMLFGREIDLNVPHLEDGEKISRELFVKSFRESGFYIALTDNS